MTFVKTEFLNVRAALLPTILATTLGIGACGASVTPRVEHGTMPVLVVYEEEFYKSGLTQTIMSFGNAPPFLRVVVEQAEVEKLGPFSMEFDREGSVSGTLLLKGKTYDIIDATNLEKEGRATTLLLTIATQDDSSTLIPAQLVTVAWPDRGRSFKRFGKPLMKAYRRDRIDDLGTLRFQYERALSRELEAAELEPTSRGFKVSYSGRQTEVDLERMLVATRAGGASIVVTKLAEATADKLRRTEETTDVEEPEAATATAAEEVDEEEAADTETTAGDSESEQPLDDDADAAEEDSATEEAVAEAEPANEAPPTEPAVVGAQGDVMCTLVPSSAVAALPRGEREKLVTVEVAPGITGLYALDYPGYFDLLSPETMKEAQLERDALAGLSRRNLLETVGKIYRVHLGKNAYLVSSEGSYDASFLLVPEIWEEMAGLVKGELVVAVPGQDVLLVTGSENTEAVKLLQEHAVDAATEEPLIRHLLVRRGGKWVRYG